MLQTFFGYMSGLETIVPFTGSTSLLDARERSARVTDLTQRQVVLADAMEKMLGTGTITVASRLIASVMVSGEKIHSSAKWSCRSGARLVQKQ